jgi:hypothetical protein
MLSCPCPGCWPPAGGQQGGHRLPEIAVRVVPGSERNIKIAYPGDLDLVETLLPGQLHNRGDFSADSDETSS